MSHQKLLDKLAYTPHTDPNGKNMYQALRAVAELHKPQVSTFDDDECAACSNTELSVIYPCETVKIIEKELA